MWLGDFSCPYGLHINKWLISDVKRFGLVFGWGMGVDITYNINNQINVCALIGQLAVVYFATKLMEKLNVF